MINYVSIAVIFAVERVAGSSLLITHNPGKNI